MSALIVLVGGMYIVLSLFFRFTARLRIVMALLVGALLSGVLVTALTHWASQGSGRVAGPLGRWIGASQASTAAAIPAAIAFALAVVVTVFLCPPGGGGGRGGGTVPRGGMARRGGALPHVALVCALLLPLMVMTAVGTQ